MSVPTAPKEPTYIDSNLQLTLSEQSDTQCPKCGLTFKKMVVIQHGYVAMAVRPGWISSVQAYLMLMISLNCIFVLLHFCAATDAFFSQKKAVS